LGRATTGPMMIRRSVEMRYGEQIFEIAVPLDDVAMNAPDLIEQVVDRFRQRHEALYTYSASDQDIVLVNVRVAVVGTLPVTPVEPPLPSHGPGAPPRMRRVYLDRWVEVPVYQWSGLVSEAEIPGPAIVESPTTTVVIRDDDQIGVTPHGWLDIRVGRSTDERAS
ncbi:MAG TPA: hydantoinase/oxoprolinase family protein, partial [bacterium]|nr:hydantoinase/oxoprolinase family protein [bacterium]